MITHQIDAYMRIYTSIMAKKQGEKTVFPLSAPPPLELHKKATNSIGG